MAPEAASKMAMLLDRVEQIQKTGGGFYAIESRFAALLDLLLPLLPYTNIPDGPVRSLTGNGVGGRFPPLRREIVDVREAVQADLARKWNLADLAGIAHISSRYLSRAFNESYGLPPLQYVAALRAKELARLLREKPETSGEDGGAQGRLGVPRPRPRRVSPSAGDQPG